VGFDLVRSFLVDPILRVSDVQPGGSAATAIDLDALVDQKPTLPAASASSAHANRSTSPIGCRRCCCCFFFFRSRANSGAGSCGYW